MFPIKNREKYKVGYRFKENTFYNSSHLGLDIITPKGTKLYAPFDGDIVRTLTGKQGGNTIWFKPKHDSVIIRFMHLNSMLKMGRYKEGDIIGYTGNTGELTTNPHLHVDISKDKVKIKDINNFIDPEKYDWMENTNSTAPEIKIEYVDKFPDEFKDKLEQYTGDDYKGNLSLKEALRGIKKLNTRLREKDVENTGLKIDIERLEGTIKRKDEALREASLHEGELLQLRQDNAELKVNLAQVKQKLDVYEYKNDSTENIVEKVTGRKKPEDYTKTELINLLIKKLWKKN